MKSKLVLGMLIAGLLQCAGYIWALHGENGFGYGCFDQDCYAQSARRIAAGHPFSYAPGLPNSTGQTSVLYPFVLAAASAGSAATSPWRMHAVSVALAVGFYLVFLVGWGIVIETLFPPNAPGRVISAALVALSGCCGYVAFAQCDQGLWMALSAMAAAALARRRRWLFVAALTLAPWVRPEGMMLVVAAIVVSVIFRHPEKRLLLPLVSAIGVFALNYALTGEAQFSSVSEKGYFRIFGFVPALRLVLEDGLSIVCTYLCSIPFPARRFFTIPTPVAAIGFWIGFIALVRRSANWKSPALIFFLAAAMCVGTTSLGGFAGLDFDRYLAWLMPIPLLTAGYGLQLLAERIRSPFWRKLPAVAAIVTAIPFAIGMVLMMHQVSEPRARHFRELREEAQHLPPAAEVGSESFFWAYSLPDDCRYRDIMGIFSPDFKGCATHLAFGQETLKHRRDLRFDYWAVEPLEARRNNARNRDLYRGLYGTPLVADAQRPHLYIADWSAYDRGAKVPDLGADWKMVSRLDVGYRPDETAAEMRPLHPQLADGFRFRAVAVESGGDALVYDGAMPVSSGLEFSLDATAGRNARLMLRTLRKIWFMDEDRNDVGLDFGATMTLRLSVDGVEVAPRRVSLKDGEFAEIIFEIPAAALRSSHPRFILFGHFAACALWLYQ